MRYLLLLLSFNVHALDCRYEWAPNPAEELISHYTVYKNGDPVTQIQAPATNYDFLCDFSLYSVSSTNILNESPLSVAIRFDPADINPDDVIPATTPSGNRIIIINNGTVNIN